LFFLLLLLLFLVPLLLVFLLDITTPVLSRTRRPQGAPNRVLFIGISFQMVDE